MNGNGCRSSKGGLLLTLSLMAFAVSACGGGSSGGGTSFASQGLWIANANSDTVIEYSQKQRKTSGSPAPALTNSSADLNFSAGLAFDSSKNMWVANGGAPSITEFSLSQLKSLSSTPAPTAVVTITSAGFSNILNLVFDSSGNLWVSDTENSSLFAFTPSQLATGGNLVPAVTITSADLNGPRNMEFDNAGNLWVAQSNNSTVVEFTKSQLSASGSPAAAVVLSDDGSGSIADPRGLLFTASGDLWLSNFGNNTLVQFSSSQITATGSPTPPIIITSPDVAEPEQLAFDHSGNLWFANFGNGTVVSFKPSQLTATGSPAANVVISGSDLDGPEEIAFGPNLK